MKTAREIIEMHHCIVNEKSSPWDEHLSRVQIDLANLKSAILKKVKDEDKEIARAFTQARRAIADIQDLLMRD